MRILMNVNQLYAKMIKALLHTRVYMEGYIANNKNYRIWGELTNPKQTTFIEMDCTDEYHINWNARYNRKKFDYRIKRFK